MKPEDNLLKTLEAIVDNYELEEVEKATVVLRLMGIQLSNINAESLAATFGNFRVSTEIEIID